MGIRNVLGADCTDPFATPSLRLGLRLCFRKRFRACRGLNESCQIRTGPLFCSRCKCATWLETCRGSADNFMNFKATDQGVPHERQGCCFAGEHTRCRTWYHTWHHTWYHMVSQVSQVSHMASGRSYGITWSHRYHRYHTWHLEGLMV